MRRIAISLVLLGLGAPAHAQSDFAVASAAEQQAILVQCQQDLGYAAAGLTLRRGGGADKGAADMLMVAPNAQISPAAASEINLCAQTSAEAVVYGTPQPARRYQPAPRAQVATYGCPPGAPVLYRGTLYCR